MTLPVGAPETPVTLSIIDAKKRRTPFPTGGDSMSRDPRSGDVTLRLVTPKSGERVSVEIVREETQTTRR